MNSAMKKKIRREEERQATSWPRWFFLASVVCSFCVLAFGGESDVPVQSAPSIVNAADACTPSNIVDALRNREAQLDCQLVQASR